MSPHLRHRLSVQLLEPRELPAASLIFAGGTVLIRGDNVANRLEINPDPAQPGAVIVRNRGVSLGSFALTGNVAIVLGNAADTVALGDQAPVAVPGSFTITAPGGGADSISLSGSIGGSLSILEGLGNDTVALNSLTVGGPITRVDGNLGTDVLTTSGPTFLSGTTLLTRVNTITLGAGFQAVALVVNNSFENVPSSLNLLSGAQVFGSLIYSGGTNTDRVSIDGPGAVGVHAVMLDRAGNNSLTLTGGSADDPTVGGGVTFVSGAGNDTFTMAGAAVGGTVYVDADNGTNVYNLTGSTALSDVIIRGGFGADLLSVLGTTIDGSLSVFLSSGTNTFTFDAVSTVQGNLSDTSYGSNVVTIDNQPGGALQLTFIGGPTTVDLSMIATPPGYFGSATIDFGVGPGPKTYLPPALWVGQLQLLNFP